MRLNIRAFALTAVLAITLAVVGSKAKAELEKLPAPGIFNYTQLTGASGNAGLTYIHLPFDEKKPDADLTENFAAALENRANQPVYIHCHSASRAAALRMIERVRADGLSIDEARSEVETISEKPDGSIAFAMSVLSKSK